MKTLLGILAAGGLMLAAPSASHAQVNVQFGRGGSPVVSFGQPSYAQQGYGYAQPGYQYAQPRYQYAQPGYGSNYGYAQPGYTQQPATTYYSSGYSGYTTPVRRYQQPYAQPYNGYASPYGQPAYSGYGRGTGVIINGRSYMLPR